MWRSHMRAPSPMHTRPKSPPKHRIVGPHPSHFRPVSPARVGLIVREGSQPVRTEPSTEALSRTADGGASTRRSAFLGTTRLLLVVPSRETRKRGAGATLKPSCADLACEFRRRGQPVEKVVVGQVGSPREPENKAKTLQKRRIQPLNRGQKGARRSFSTG